MVRACWCSAVLSVCRCEGLYKGLTLTWQSAFVDDNTFTLYVQALMLQLLLDFFSVCTFVDLFLFKGIMNRIFLKKKKQCIDLYKNNPSQSSHMTH